MSARGDRGLLVTPDLLSHLSTADVIAFDKERVVAQDQPCPEGQSQDELDRDAPPAPPDLPYRCKPLTREVPTIVVAISSEPSAGESCGEGVSTSRDREQASGPRITDEAKADRAPGTLRYISRLILSTATIEVGLVFVEKGVSCVKPGLPHSENRNPEFKKATGLAPRPQTERLELVAGALYSDRQAIPAPEDFGVRVAELNVL